MTVTRIFIRTEAGDRPINVRCGQSVLDAMIEAGLAQSAVCGGTGRCGQCRVQVAWGDAPVNAADKACFTDAEIAAGYRLACRLYPLYAMTVTPCFCDETAFDAVTEYGSATAGDDASDGYGIAVDIGSTTVAMQVVALPSGAIRATHTALNPQRRYGADVIARQDAATNGKGEELRRLIRETLTTGMQTLLQDAGIAKTAVRRVVVAGNTTMIHLLMGYDCAGLGVYPFTPVNIARIETRYDEIFLDGGCAVPVTVLPGVSTYVGGDIVSGLYAKDVDRNGPPVFFIDLGTNGEMALGNRDRILVTSTAAGPAFEGGNIRDGVGSIRGAVDSVRIENGRAAVTTIGNDAPVGICGTGVIEAIAAMVQETIVDETGYLDDGYAADGFVLCRRVDGTSIAVTQADVRELQLAKAAVRAGIETLMLRYGIDKADVATVYLAGGFGFRLSEAAALAIGLIPREFAGKIRVVGNTALGGAVRALVDPEAAARTDAIAANAQEIGLATDADFNRLYMEHMGFE